MEYVYVEPLYTYRPHGLFVAISHKVLKGIVAYGRFPRNVPRAAVEAWVKKHDAPALDIETADTLAF